MQPSFFRPYTYFQDFGSYSYFSRFDYDVMCDLLGRIYEADEALPNNQETVEQHARALEGHLERSVFANDPRGTRALSLEIIRGSRRMFRLEQLLLLLAMSKPEFFGEIVEVEGLDALREMGACIMVTPHVGPHFIVTLLLTKLGVHVATGGGITGEFLESFTRIAEFHGIETTTSSGFLFSDDFRIRCAQLLSRGTSIMLYPEYSRSQRKGNLLVNFLGNDVHAPTGVARLAQQARRKLVMVELRPRGPFRYVLRVGPTWEPPSLNDEASVESTICSIFQEVERGVVEQPAAWMGWEFFDTMKTNGFEVLTRQLAAERASRKARENEAPGP